MTVTASSTATSISGTPTLDYPWLRAFRELDRPFLPADLDVGDIQVEAMVFVQANPVWDQVEDETTWVQHLRGHDSRIQGVVAGVPLDRGASRGQRVA